MAVIDELPGSDGRDVSPMVADLQPPRTGWRAAGATADRHRLTVYAALYLQLAADIDAELATLDRALGRAAATEGVEVTRIA